ncbi:undecaprenyl-diphosphatase [Clostridium frigidicarnis]|uniref:Undecaprenyl-diphosphatase n=1 Tax=Clostridium frigidicarnis TaxID=84698 RepID=A0A1I0ZX85_9CLOT|nr:undecaprenyl-diphosphatase [Clostridium frigidicarnis]SFB29962.1 Undecaprenyl-diphosphatase [Clostridium frigidicarnis]
MNDSIFTMINGVANKNEFLDKVMIFISNYGPYISIFVVCAIFLMGLINRNENQRKIAVDTFFITVIGMVISFIIGSIYYRERPFVNNKVNLLIEHKSNASFPSDHSLGTMSIAVGMGMYNKILGIILGVLSLLVGISRVYVGNHYPIDVLAGYVIAWVIGYLYSKFLRKYVQKIYGSIECILGISYKNKH